MLSTATIKPAVAALAPIAENRCCVGVSNSSVFATASIAMPVSPWNADAAKLPQVFPNLVNFNPQKLTFLG